MSYVIRRIPSRSVGGYRMRRGLGDCTPENCSGPYDNSIYNYDYWIQQGSQRGLIQEDPGQQTQPIDIAPIQEAMDSSLQSHWATYDQLKAAFGIELCNQSDAYAQAACSQRNIPRMQQISNLQIRYNGAVPVSAIPGGGSIAPVAPPPPAPVSSAPPAPLFNGSTVPHSLPVQFPPSGNQTGYILPISTVPAVVADSSFFGVPLWALAAGVGALVLLR